MADNCGGALEGSVECCSATTFSHYWVGLSTNVPKNADAYNEIKYVGYKGQP